jgi:DNA-binding SARP family transcriptional activator
MLALAGTGQRAQALRAYQQARRALVDELGIEPGQELRDIHQRILADGAMEKRRTGRDRSSLGRGTEQGRSS